MRHVNMADVSVTNIGILLAVYNGGDFLAQQLDSIAAQDDLDWVLYARDDGSSDHSPAILEEYSKQDERIHPIFDTLGNLGASNNFASLMKMHGLDSNQYIAFSDQDDVWQRDKLSSQLNAMQQLERQFLDSPLLVHSDMEVVDGKLECIAPSFMRHQGIEHINRGEVKVLLAQNFVTGCTVLVNRRLLDIALPVPDEALMHDWWLALCAAVFGHIGYIDQPLVKYRQHGKNEVGAKYVGDYINPMHGEWKKRWYEGRDNLFKSMKQAQALADRIRQHDPKNRNLALVEAYASLQNLPPLKRIGKLHVLGIHAQSRSRQVLLLSRLLLTPKNRYG